MSHCSIPEANVPDVLELEEAQNKVDSTIFCTRHDTSKWHENLCALILTDVICDRLIHNAYTIQIEGESTRKRILE